jgi:dinuclear metal center YbgI/SA1388 family protein
MSVDRRTLVSYLNGLLSITDIPDDSCNGLQVEGNGEVALIGLAVDGCLNVYKKAVACNCQMLIVHHGLIWKGLTSITGTVRGQIDFLLRNDLNLYAAHLPLDMHAEFGNNIELTRILGLTDVRPFGAYKGKFIGFSGTLPQALDIRKIGDMVSAAVGGTFFTLPFGKALNRTIAVISGGGSDAIPEAIDAGIDCFVTGESSHKNHHIALEAGINVVYSGHYYTEILGVKALGNHLKKAFDVKTIFIDEPTLV